MAHIPPHAEDNSDSSESDLSIQEVVINNSDTVTIFSAGPNNATSSLPKPATALQFFLIPKTAYAPAYSSPFLINLYENYPLPQDVKLENLFEHLNCFQLTPVFDSEGPTLNSLKQHAAAICCLINYIHGRKNKGKVRTKITWPLVAADPKFFGAFDFLNNVLHEPFPEEGRSGDPQHSEPLGHLLNSITSEHPGLGELSSDQAALLREANKILTRLDEIYRDTGGLQSIPLPPLHSPMRESLLARWIEYVQRLKRRLISLQSESIALRQVLSHEAVVPSVRSKSSGRPTRRSERIHEKVIPQDRYIFTGLSEGLHSVLRQQLNMTSKEAESWAHDLPKEGSRGIFDRGWEDFFLDGSARGIHNEDRQWNVNAWIETASRLYKVRGHDTIFVIPGFGIHPDAHAIDEHDRKVLDQLYPDPKKKEKMEREREVARDRLKVSEKTVERLRERLRKEKGMTIGEAKVANLKARLFGKEQYLDGNTREETGQNTV